MRSALRRWKSLALGCLVSAFASIILAGMLSLLRPELVFAGFPMAAALGGTVAGYRGQHLRLLQGALSGLVAGLVELVFLLGDSGGFLPSWALAGLVAINCIAGMLGARGGYALHKQPPKPIEVAVTPVAEAIEPDGDRARAVER